MYAVEECFCYLLKKYKEDNNKEHLNIKDKEDFLGFIMNFEILNHCFKHIGKNHIFEYFAHNTEIQIELHKAGISWQEIVHVISDIIGKRQEVIVFRQNTNEEQYMKSLFEAMYGCYVKKIEKREILFA
jgi:hypothetical protein